MHRFVAANGARFHLVEAGLGPLVLLVHGFPEFWWAWRAQLPALAAAGYRAVAVDLRGFGASDKPPTGYTEASVADDLSALIRALGEERAVIVGHGVGGWFGWALAARHPEVVRALVTVAAPHPLATVRPLLGRARAAHQVHQWLRAMQLPPASNTEFEAAPSGVAIRGAVAQRLRDWSGPDRGWLAEYVVDRYADAATLPFTRQASAEFSHALIRSWLDPRERVRLHLRRRGSSPTTPVLLVHGDLDRAVPSALTAASTRFVGGPIQLAVLARTGHFVPEEASAEFTTLLTQWLDTL